MSSQYIKIRNVFSSWTHFWNKQIKLLWIKFIKVQPSLEKERRSYKNKESCVFSLQHVQLACFFSLRQQIVTCDNRDSFSLQIGFFKVLRYFVRFHCERVLREWDVHHSLLELIANNTGVPENHFILVFHATFLLAYFVSWYARR